MADPAADALLELESLRTQLGVEIEDAAEESFLLFAQEIPSQNLGFVDPSLPHLDMDVGKRTYAIKQSPGLLKSDRDAGTTGAVLWKVTPLVAEWLSSNHNFLFQSGWLRRDSTVVELGCGISGLIALSLAASLDSGLYLLTDQAYVMKLLNHNIHANQSRQPVGKGKHPRQQSQIRTLVFDWEEDAVSNISRVLGQDRGIDLILACDCIYNDYLIQPFVTTCASLCALPSNGSRKTGLLIAQQLRSEEVLQMWLNEMLKSFAVFRIPADLLSGALKKGYVLHLSILK